MKSLDEFLSNAQNRKEMFDKATEDIINELSQIGIKKKSDEIKIGKASILTVIDGSNIEEFDINIIKINTR